ncbi:hypothetical protein G6F22_021131 [Rhizopus arrhizus]|nr:hypothetical protein G6F22_021131 [Rhizopus arrhizus]
MGQVAHVGAAVFLVGRHAQHAEFAEFAPEVHGELVAAIDFSRAGRDLGLREIAHGVAQHVQGFAQWVLTFLWAPAIGAMPPSEGSSCADHASLRNDAPQILRLRKRKLESGYP